MNKKAISPLVATVLLVVFALVLGIVTMSWGKAYVKEAPVKDAVIESKVSGCPVVIRAGEIDNSLKELQIDYIMGKISKEQYLAREKGLVGG